MVGRKVLQGESPAIGPRLQATTEFLESLPTPLLHADEPHGSCRITVSGKLTHERVQNLRVDHERFIGWLTPKLTCGRIP